MTDAELVARARGGDTVAFDLLVGRHQVAVYRAALAALRSPEDAEEVAQEAFVRAWSHLDRYRGDAAFRTWLLAIVWNRALTRRRVLALWRRRRAPIEAADGVAGESGTAEGRCRELRRQAAAAIERLSPKLRDALLLAQSGDHDYEAMAVLLAVPVGTVKWRVFEARRKVRLDLARLGLIDAR